MDVGSEIAPIFYTHGFARLSVESLRDLSGLTMRRLYEAGSNRDGMIVAALRSWDGEWRRFVTERSDQDEAVDPVLALFDILGQWMIDRPSAGCLFIRASTDLPDVGEITEAVADHKAGYRSEIGQRVARGGHDPEIVDAVLVVFEGVVAAAVTIGNQTAFEAGRRTLQALLNS